MTKHASAWSAMMFVAGSLAMGASGCGAENATSGASSTSAANGSHADATDFTTRDINGKTVRLSDHLGKETILIDFWATYCEPCRAEFPHLQALYEAQKAHGFVVLAVSMDGPETLATVPQIAKSYDVTFPVLLDEDSSIASTYNPKKSAPLSVLIDKTGKIIRVREGYNPGDEKLVADDVNKAVAGQPL